MAAALLLLAFGVLYAFSNLTVLGQELENSWARQYDQTTPGLLLDDSRWFPPFHFDVATIVVGVVVSVALTGFQRRWRALALVLVATPGAIVAGELFKHFAGRPRLVQSLDFDVSYPSGHAGIALATTAALLIAIPRPHLRWSAPLLVAWCFLVVGGLQAEGQHRASEVLGSGLLIAGALLLADGLWGPSSGSVRPSTIWSARARGALLVPLLVVLLVGAWTPVPWMTAVYGAATLIAVGLVCGTAFRVRRAPEHRSLSDR